MKRRGVFATLGGLLAGLFESGRGVYAQSETSPPRAVILTRNVIERGIGEAGSPPFDFDTVEIPIRNFRSEDADAQDYLVVELRERGFSTAEAIPDGGGVLRRTVAKRAEAVQYYYFARHRITGDLLYTFDLQDVSLVPLLNSLTASLQPLAERNAQLQSYIALYLRHSAVYPTVSLVGVNLNLEDTLDLVRRGSGLEVIRSGNQLVINE